MKQQEDEEAEEEEEVKSVKLKGGCGISLGVFLCAYVCCKHTPVAHLFYNQMPLL